METKLSQGRWGKSAKPYYFQKSHYGILCASFPFALHKEPTVPPRKIHPAGQNETHTALLRKKDRYTNRMVQFSKGHTLIQKKIRTRESMPKKVLLSKQVGCVSFYSATWLFLGGGCVCALYRAKDEVACKLPSLQFLKIVPLD